jgi:DNA-binding HxlR family transcriptional regulator
MALNVEFEATAVGATAVAPLENLGTFKFWRIQNSNAAKLLKEIIFQWRGASGYIRGKPGKWAVWPRERWCEWTGLSRNQLDRALKELVESKLIYRERHRFAGSKVRAFLQPAAVALKHMGRPQDLAQAVPASEKVSEKSTEKITKKTSEKASEKISEKFDYTSIPSIPTYPNNTTSTKEQTEPPMLLDEKGKGKAGDDEIEKKFAEVTAKKQKAADKLFPEKKGPHENYVKNPSKIFPKWLSYSPEAKNNIYQKYLLYIDNWNKGKKGSAYFDEWTEEADAALKAAIDNL